MNKVIYQNLLREEKLPHMWCPGCGIGIIFGALLRAMSKAGLEKDRTVIVSGIGCSGRISGYIDVNSLHTTHGRPLAFATGIKLAKPELSVIVAAGDGDAIAIGGNHFIHSCRRNIDITMIVFNNWIYGMTGGQLSPATPEKSITTTAPFGSIEPVFDISQLAINSGATFVARSTAYHVFELEDIILKAIQHKGFSVVEALSPCPVNYGRRNKMRMIEMYLWLKENVIPVTTYKELPPEKRKGKISRGILAINRERIEYVERYREKITHG